jgi:PAS domain S-box-containing protein
LLRKDGTHILVRYIGKAVEPPDMSKGILWLMEDITERKRAEEALRKSEELLRALFDSSPVGIELYDREGLLIDANRTCLAIFGITDIAAVKKFKLFDDPNLDDAMKQALRNGRAVEKEVLFDFDLVRELGIYPTVQTGQIVLDLFLSPLRSDADEVEEGYLVHVRDITKRKRAEEKVQQSEAKYRHLFESSTDGIFILDLDGNFIDMNSTACTRLGYTKEEMLGLHISTLDDPEFVPRFPERMKQISEHGFVVFESAHLRKDGTAMPVEVNSQLIGYEGRTVVLSVIRDITERKKTEKKLMILNQELQAKAMALERAYKDMESFSYSISHDLRAPLRIILGFSDILQKDHYDKLDDDCKELLNLIIKNTQRLEQLVLAILDLSRTGRQEMDIVEINMEKAASLIAGDLKAMAPERTINIDIKKLPPAHGDLKLIRQVLNNILSNAVKFTKDRDIAVIEVGGRCEDNENVYFVKDNGAGFAMDHADKLFKVFQRLHTAKEFEGIGIGLSIVDRIIKRHGGRLWAEGKPAEGATFYFTLPKKGE